MALCFSQEIAKFSFVHSFDDFKKLSQSIHFIAEGSEDGGLIFADDAGPEVGIAAGHAGAIPKSSTGASEGIGVMSEGGQCGDCRHEVGQMADAGDFFVVFLRA